MSARVSMPVDRLIVRSFFNLSERSALVDLQVYTLSSETHPGLSVS